MAAVAFDRSQQAADLFGSRDRSEVLDLRSDKGTTKIGRYVAIGSCRRNTIAEHPAEHAAHPPSALIAASRFDLAQDGQHLLWRDLRNREGPDHRIGHAEQPADLVERDRRAAFPLILADPFLSDRLEGIVCSHLAREVFDPFLGSRIETGGDLLPSLLAQLTGGGDTYFGPRAKIEGLLPGEVPVIHSPQLRAVRLNEKIEPVGIGQFEGLVPGLGVGDLDVIQCHDGASSKGLADTIKNTIILMVLPMDSGG
jgi:hypothetical protein